MGIATGGTRSLIILLILSTFIPASIISTSANASLVESRMIDKNGETLTTRKINELKVKRVLENKLVKAKLTGAGLTAEEVTRKMDRMTDEEIHQLASLSDRMPAGGNAVGFVLGVLAITVLVLVILYLAKRV